MIKDEQRIKEAAQALFLIEHQMFAANLGLIEHSGELLDDQSLIRDLVFSIDELAWSTESEDRRLAIQMIALTWEHSTSSLRARMREFFILSLSRLGVAPSTQMIDLEFKRNSQYAGISSFRSKLAAVSMQIQSQLLIGKIRYQLTEFQKRVWDAFSRTPYVGISAPTSAGKSFAIYLLIVDSALRSGLPSVYIVPTISLVNQVTADLTELLDSHGLTNWVVSSSYETNQSNTLFVLTQERAILAIDRGLLAQNLEILVIDEVQNLEKVSDDDETRSKILFDFLHDVREMRSANKIILSGPRLENIGLVGEAVFDTDFAEERALESPVASITYAVEQRGSEFYLNQFRNSLSEKSSLKIEDIERVQGLLSKGYGEEYYTTLAALVDSLGDSSKNLIFCPTTDQARKVATRLPGFRERPLGEQALLELSQYLAEAIHPRHRLVELVQRGVAFHSGSLPPHARLVVEQAFSDGLLKDVACTTTLMQGVNLPAKNVFIRNPNLFVQRRAGCENAELTEYEFANLRGRAGRLLRDFVGRTIVLNEEAFRTVSDQQDDLFKDTYKSLRLTYADILERNREEIFSELQVAGTANSQGAKFISTYVRQQLFRDDQNAPARLQSVGLKLPADILQKVGYALKGLSIRRETILENRYWDPFDLQKISDELSAQKFEKLPETVWQARVPELVKLLGLLATVCPNYFRRFLGDVSSNRFLIALVLSGISWARETPLRTILEDRKFNDDEDYESKIDDQIELIYRKVVYGLPALLKPIASIQGQGTAFLASLESGAYHPVTHYLMSLGLYRETAVYLKRRNFGQIRGDDPNLTSLVDERVPSSLHGLNRWTSRQVETTLNRKLRRNANG